MHPADPRAARRLPPSPFARLAAFGWFVVSTLLMIDMREALDAATGGDKSDAGYKHGL